MKEEEKADLILENNLTYNFEKILNNISNLIDEPLSLNSRKINEKDDYEMERINYELLNNISFNESENDLYDLEEYFFEYIKEKNQIFHIEKNFKIKDNSINNIFEEEQKNEIYNPFQMEIDLENDLKKNNIDHKNSEENNSNSYLMTTDLSTSDFYHNINNMNKKKIIILMIIF